MVTAEFKGDKLILTIDASKEARDDANVSSTGKSRLLASTGGFTNVGQGIKVNVTAILPLKA